MDALWLIFTITFATILVFMLIDFELKDKKNLYNMGLFVILIILFDMFVWINYGYETFMKFYTFLAQIPLYIAFLFISKYRGLKLLFVHLTVVALVSSVVLISAVIAGSFGLTNFQMNTITLVLYIPAGVITYKFFRPYILYMLRNSDKGWLLFCVMPFTYAIVTYTYGQYDIKAMSSSITLLPMIRGLLFTFLSYFLVLWLFKQTREQLTLQNEQNLLQMQVMSSKQNLDMLKESQEKTLVYRHDMRHHLSLINYYLNDNNQEAAKSYIAEVEKSIEDAVFEKYCSNYSVNLIVSSYVAKAKKMGITVDTKIDLPENTAISDMDLCVIFANALENAVTACKNIPDPKDRSIQIVCKTKNNKPFIQITNSYDGKVTFEDGMPVSTEENHGFGTKSIAMVARKYNGVFSFTSKDGLFQTNIIL